MTEEKSSADRMIKARVQLLVRYPFFGHLALALPLVPVEEIGTMSTEGVHLFYNPAFVESLKDDVLQFAIAHEILHCVLGHVWRGEKRDHDRWNQATDHAVNIILNDEGFTLWEKCLCSPTYRNMSAEQVYDFLPEILPGNDPNSGSHKKWNEGAGSSDKKLEGKWKENMVRAANAVRSQGKLPGTLGDMIDGLLEPELDWKDLLRDVVMTSVRNDFRMLPPSKKHLWRQMYLPSLSGDCLEIAIAVDTSGSITVAQFQEFMSEVKGITEQFSTYLIHLFFCDVRIHERVLLTPEDQWPEKFPKCGGGTDFKPVFEAIEEDELPISLLLYFTDGYGDFPNMQPEHSVMWVLNSSCNVPWGEYIRMGGSP